MVSPPGDGGMRKVTDQALQAVVGKAAADELEAPLLPVAPALDWADEPGPCASSAAAAAPAAEVAVPAAVPSESDLPFAIGARPPPPEASGTPNLSVSVIACASRLLALRWACGLSPSSKVVSWLVSSARKAAVACARLRSGGQHGMATACGYIPKGRNRAAKRIAAGGLRAAFFCFVFAEGRGTR